VAQAVEVRPGEELRVREFFYLQDVAAEETNLKIRSSRPPPFTLPQTFFRKEKVGCLTSPLQTLPNLPDRVQVPELLVIVKFHAVFRIPSDRNYLASWIRIRKLDGFPDPDPK